MGELLVLLQQSLFMTAIDLDNATYTTAAIQPLKPKQQQKAILWATLLEFAGRLLLVAVFLILANEEEPLFTVFGIEFTIENISLLGAGTFLLVRNSWELANIQRGADSRESGTGPEERQPVKPTRFRSVVFEMGLVLTVMSIDTVLAGLAIVTGFWALIFLFLVSAGVRLLFVQQLAAFVRRYPAINIVVLAFLVLIGVELIVQGFGLDIEPVFNLVLVASLLVAVIYQARRAKSPVSSRQ